MLMLLTGKPTAGRGNSPREERATEPRFRLDCTEYTVPPKKADQCKSYLSKTKTGGRVDHNGNNGNYTTSITKIAKQPCSDPISARIKPVKCWLVFRKCTLNQRHYHSTGYFCCFTWQHLCSDPMIHRVSAASSAKVGLSDKLYGMFAKPLLWQ